MTQNEHVYVICCRLEVAGDVIASENIKTIEGYAVLNFKVASFSSFRDIQNNSFRDGAGGGHQRKRIRISLNKKATEQLTCRLMPESHPP